MKLNYDFKMKHDNSLFVSVFNLHEVDRRKAEQAYSFIYGKRALKQLKDHIKTEGGIMCIFNQKPTDDLIMYALMITQAQNQRRD